jgi:ABC-type Fe3+/spermidine/putrescine transport system ATPase subunit
MADVKVRSVSRSFGAHKALDDVSIDFPDGGFYALLGPSGSGKTTLLRQIAGFDFPDAGRISIGGEEVERVPVEKRHIGMVFQNYALFPNMSVADNVGFGLSVRGRPRAEIASEVQRALDLVQLGKLGERRPHQLSAVSASASRSPGRSSSGRACCCSTNRSAHSTRPCVSTCRSNSSASSAKWASPPSSSPTTRRRR